MDDTGYAEVKHTTALQHYAEASSNSRDYDLPCADYDEAVPGSISEYRSVKVLPSTTEANYHVAVRQGSVSIHLDESEQ